MSLARICEGLLNDIMAITSSVDNWSWLAPVNLIWKWIPQFREPSFLAGALEYWWRFKVFPVFELRIGGMCTEYTKWIWLHCRPGGAFYTPPPRWLSCESATTILFCFVYMPQPSRYIVDDWICPQKSPLPTVQSAEWRQALYVF